MCWEGQQVDKVIDLPPDWPTSGNSPSAAGAAVAAESLSSPAPAAQSETADTPLYSAAPLAGDSHSSAAPDAPGTHRLDY